MTSPLSLNQRNIVITAWVTYASYYLCRVNLSAAIPALESDLSLTKGQVGWLLTGFFLVYACSTLVNGYLGDRLSPRYFVATGMLVSAALNLLFGFSSLWIFLLLIWCINGYFQATGWGPILRMVANWLSPAQRSKISSFFGASFVAGNALTWVLTGWLVSQFGWRWAFWLPALLLAAMALIWLGSVRDTPQGGIVHTSAAKTPFWQGLAQGLRRFWALAIAALFSGFIFGMFSLWSPSYFVDVAKVDVGLGSRLASLLPLAGIGGIMVIGWWVGRFLVKREPFGLMMVLLLLAALCLTYTLIPFQLAISVTAMMLISAFAYGATTLILATMPLALGQQGETSSTAGLIDFAFGIGTSLSGAVIGAILESLSWSWVFVALAVCGLLAAGFVWLAMRLRHDA